MSIRELSRGACAPLNTLSQLERGLTTNDTTETAKRLAMTRQVGVNDLVGMYEEGEGIETNATAVTP